jgi:hypothetical protein
MVQYVYLSWRKENRPMTDLYREECHRRAAPGNDRGPGRNRGTARDSSIAAQSRPAGAVMRQKLLNFGAYLTPGSRTGCVPV